MNYFYPNATYDEAIKKQDKVVLRALLVGIIGSDPTFATTEFEEACKYIREKSISFNGQELILTEPYKMQEGEYKKDDWDEDYYKLNLVWLEDNFALDQRLDLIKRMGKSIYKDELTFGKSKYQNRMAEKNKSHGKKQLNPLVIIILAALGLLLVFVLVNQLSS